MDAAIDEALIKKETIYAGSKFINFKPGTRVEFHYRTVKGDGSETVIDDSKKNGKPMQLVLGKKFKLEVWEVIVQKMALNEVAKFHVDKSVIIKYFLFDFNFKYSRIFIIACAPISLRFQGNTRSNKTNQGSTALLRYDFTE